MAPLSHHSKLRLTLIITNWNTHLENLAGNPGPTRMVAAISKKAKHVIGAGVYRAARTTLAWLNSMVLV